MTSPLVGGGWPADSPGNIAWLAMLSTSIVASPALTESEKGRLRGIRDHTPDPRVAAYAAAVATVNSVT